MKKCKLSPDKHYRNSHGAIRKVTHASPSMVRYIVTHSGARFASEIEKEGSTKIVSVNEFLNWATSEVIV